VFLERYSSTPRSFYHYCCFCRDYGYTDTVCFWHHYTTSVSLYYCCCCLLWNLFV